jgi:hypothetical protein
LFIRHHLDHVLSDVLATLGAEILHALIVIAAVIPEAITLIAVVQLFLFETLCWPAFLAVWPLLLVWGEASITLYLIKFYVLPLGYVS